MTERYHFVGIGGAGMSVIAEVLLQQGAEITGSDRHESAVLDRLRARGIIAFGTHDETQVPRDAILVVSSAIRESNVELRVARSRGQRVLHRSEALALAARNQRFVAVAGAHGKTSTSALLTQALYHAGQSPSCAIGGPILGLDSGAILGEGDIFVAEADESDGSFLNYRPSVAIITNIEADHLDHFGSIQAFENIFYEFASRIEAGGTLICCAEDPGSARLAERARIGLPELNVVTYGRPDRCEGPNIELTEVRVHRDSGSARLRVEGRPETDSLLDLRVTGEHNLLNAAGAWAAGLALGMDPQDFASDLATFEGAGRRFELKGTVDDKRVVVDYAHHPTEVRAALRQARLVAGEGKVIAVFQPHLYSRTVNFASRFAEELSAADQVVLADIFAAREDPIPGVTTRLVEDELRALGSEPHYRPGESVAGSAVRGAELTESGDLLILVGAGDINQGADAALAYWENA